MNIRFIKREEWNECMNLCWRTFLVFEADEYSTEGVKNFFEFVTSSTVEDMFIAGDYVAMAAFDDNNKVIGFLGCRNGSHISLLFVDKNYHHQGIATALVKFLADYLKNLGIESTTVYSSPYATGFYHAMGFTDLDVEQERDGIRFTPMIMEL